jgi:gamma-glutamyl-gamma-aminobutyrate hydrolase PuuD
MNLVLRLGQKKEQKFQNQSTAQPAAFDFEIGKAHGEVNVPNVLGADKARIGHGFGEPIALIAAGGGAMVIFAAFSQILAADILIAFLSVSAVEPTAFIAQKFHLVLLGICQGVQFFKVLVQAKIRHNIAEIGAPGYPCQRQQVGQDDNFRIQR